MHTLRTWYVRESMRLSDGDEVAFCIDSEPTSCIADVWVDEEGAEAHAHLIAAAPELLQALKDCAEVMENLGNCKQERFRALKAIAKAEPV